MQLHGHKHKVAVTGRCAHAFDGATQRAVELACARAEHALLQGRLLSSGEALALAGPEARSKETLYSIARATVWEHGGEIDDVLAKLEERHPDLV